MSSSEYESGECAYRIVPDCGMLRCRLETDTEKLEQVVLALLYLNSFKEGEVRRAWKSLPWEIMDSLHQKGYISDPVNKNKSVWLTDEGAKLSEELFEKFFGGP
jgi:hypothetical protein